MVKSPGADRILSEPDRGELIEQFLVLRDPQAVLADHGVHPVTLG
jgi:hypothetical protein